MAELEENGEAIEQDEYWDESGAQEYQDALETEK